MLSRILLALGLLLTPTTWAAAQKTDLPKVVLIGDSIRLGYAPLVAKRLEGKAIILSVKANGGDSANVLKHLDEWASKPQPAVIHFNCGLHDLKLDRKKKTYQVDIDQYENNLKHIVQRLQKETKANLVFASTTPIHDERHAKRGGFDRLEADVRRYNAKAIAVMKAHGIVVDDLHWMVTKNDPAKLLSADGTHYTKAGNELLADAVADVVLRQLTIRATQKPPAKSTNNPKAGEEYRKKEKELDALVPPAFKKLPIGTFHIPKNEAAWKQQRPDVLKKVLQSLGDLPPRPSPQKVRIVSRELRNGYTVERIAIDNGVDSEVSCLLLVPEGLKKPARRSCGCIRPRRTKRKSSSPTPMVARNHWARRLSRRAMSCCRRMLIGTATGWVRGRRVWRRRAALNRKACTSIICGWGERCGACLSATIKWPWIICAAGRRWMANASAPPV